MAQFKWQVGCGCDCGCFCDNEKYWGPFETTIEKELESFDVLETLYNLSHNEYGCWGKYPENYEWVARNATYHIDHVLSKGDYIPNHNKKTACGFAYFGNPYATVSEGRNGIGPGASVMVDQNHIVTSTMKPGLQFSFWNENSLQSIKDDLTTHLSGYSGKIYFYYCRDHLMIDAGKVDGFPIDWASRTTVYNYGSFEDGMITIMEFDLTNSVTIADDDPHCLTVGFYGAGTPYRFEDNRDYSSADLLAICNATGYVNGQRSLNYGNIGPYYNYYTPPEGFEDTIKQYSSQLDDRYKATLAAHRSVRSERNISALCLSDCTQIPGASSSSHQNNFVDYVNGELAVVDPGNASDVSTETFVIDSKTATTRAHRFRSVIRHAQFVGDFYTIRYYKTEDGITRYVTEMGYDEPSARILYNAFIDTTPDNIVPYIRYGNYQDFSASYLSNRSNAVDISTIQDASNPGGQS